MRITIKHVAGIIFGTSVFGLVQGTYFHFSGEWAPEGFFAIPLVVSMIVAVAADIG